MQKKKLLFSFQIMNLYVIINKYLMINKHIKILLIVICFSCNNEVARKPIPIGVTYKIKPDLEIASNVTVTYQWFVGNYPENSDYMFRVHGNKAFITPDIKGKYDIFVSIRDENDQEIYLLDFNYIAFLDSNKFKKNKDILVKAKEPILSIQDSNSINNIQPDSIKIDSNPQ